LQKKIRKFEYQNIKQLMADLRLMFRNAFTFNLEGTDMWKATEDMERYLNNEVKRIFAALNIAADDEIFSTTSKP